LHKRKNQTKFIFDERGKDMAIRPNIGFVATRFKGNDGVSMETEKWQAVLERMGYSCFYFGGECDEKELDYTYLLPEANFKHPDILKIREASFSQVQRPSEITREIHRIKDHLKENISRFVKQYEIRLLIAENSLAIPLNLPLGLALTEYIAETNMPTIAHHHDFFWERKQFLVNCIWDYLNMSFPPHLPSVRHVVINSSASNQLSLRTGISAMLIPNVMDFDHPPSPADAYTSNLREDLGMQQDEFFVLQPTRVVQRKGIEHAIELLKRIDVKARLVISHASGDEGYDYEKRIRNYAQLMDVPTSFISDIIKEKRGRLIDGRKVYTLWDAYRMADLVTYPSTIEGFGNAFLEAIYFHKPIVVNNYSIFAIDIKPKGFRVIEFDGYITDATAREVEMILQTPSFVQELTKQNYELARQHYSYGMLERRLLMIMKDFFGEEI
jgi:glycosyltransferase involved in cell wall biosynthesis